MSLFNSSYFDDHEQVTFVSDPSVGLKAIIAIHNTTLGPAIGGTRFLHYADDQDAIDDVLRLSKGMTYKAALAALPVGGGKAVILANAQNQKPKELLERYAHAVNKLNGLFLTGEDVGIQAQDIEIIGSISPFIKGTQKDGCGETSPITAHGVVQGMKGALHVSKDSADLRGKTVAIQGLGKVGFALARLLRAEHVKVIACDIDSKRAELAQTDLGVQIVAPDAIYDVNADIFAPCGLGHVLDADTIAQLNVHIVAGCANNQLATPEMGALLQARKILYAPDYVINAGGLINVFAAGPQYNRSQVLRRVDKIYQTSINIFQTSEKLAEPTNLVADQMAQEYLRQNAKKREQKLQPANG